MSSLFVLLWLGCTVWFVVSIVKVGRKTGNTRTVALSFGAGLVAFLLASITGLMNLSTPQGAAVSSTSGKPTSTSTLPVTKPQSDKMVLLRDNMADSCASDVAASFPQYASSKASVKVVTPAVIKGDEVRIQMSASGVKFNCQTSREAQDDALPVIANPEFAKKLDARQAATAALEAKKVDKAAKAAATASAKAEQQAADTQARQEACGGVQMVIESWNWSIDEYDYVHGNGEVTNISDSPLKNIEASMSIYTADDTFIKDASAIIKYNPILPSQTSSFELIDTANPAMKHARLKVNELFGGEIGSMDRKAYDSTCS